LLKFSGTRIWLGSLACIGIAVVGTFTALAVRPVPAAKPTLKHSLAAWGVPREIRELLRSDSSLFWAIIVVAVFWMVGGMVLPTVNALGKTQLQLDDGSTSILSACMGIGIAAGCMLGGYLSRGRINPRVVYVGTAGAVLMLAVMCLPGTHHGHLLGFYGSIPVLILLGVFSGMFIVPVQVTLQSRPPRDEKGRMIATMNQISWVGVILGAVVYEACIMVLDRTGGARSIIFGVTALLLLPVALLYRPKEEKLSEATV
jgi:acyl-[acyl-carrier-protein]-phospholipid O-acyltransferase/long-chain-fatty-acid--[acyl-carrier-protein] ligase